MNDQIFSISIEDKQKLSHWHFFFFGKKRECTYYLKNISYTIRHDNWHKLSGRHLSNV